MPASNVHLGCPGAFRLACSAAALGLIAALPAMAQSCGALGSPYSINGCIVPGGGGTPSYRIQADPVNRGQFRVQPIQPAAPSIVPPGMNPPSIVPPGMRPGLQFGM